MDIQPGDVLEMKKEHPCGAPAVGGTPGGDGFPPALHRLRPGGDAPRKKAEKALKKIISPADQAGEDRRNPYAL